MAFYKVLLVEDEIEMLEGLKNIINWEEHGFCVVAALRNGAEALECALRLMPDVIVTDITMPGMNGLEMLRELKKKLPRVKSIVLTCHEDFLYAKEVISLGADEYLVKHMLTEEILTQTIIKIKQVLDSGIKSLYNHIGAEVSDISSSTGQTGHLSELCNLYDVYIQPLKSAVKNYDAATYAALSYELLLHITQKYHPALRRAMLCRILIESALALPDAAGISLEIIQLKNNDCSVEVLFANAVELISKKISFYKNNTSNPQVLKAIAYIEVCLSDNDLSLDVVSKHVNMNSSYFSRLLKQELGVSFTDFVLEKRLKKASEFLMTTSLSVDEITQLIGINSPSYFYRIYKRITGKTPSEVRNNTK